MRRKQRTGPGNTVPEIVGAMEHQNHGGITTQAAFAGYIVPANRILSERGGMKRIDGESETFIAHALRADGFDASEDGTGRWTPLVAVAFDTTQITSKANRSNPKSGDPCHPLASGAHPPAIAFSCKDHGADAGEISPTLRSMGHDGSHANAGGQAAVAFRACGQEGFTPSEVAPPITSTDGGGAGVPSTLHHMAVRRLTPVECARLQGFSDHHTAITFRGKPAADGPQYKAYGNSMAVPVLRWILNRVEAATK